MAIFAVSCSDKVTVKGTISGGSPLERVEVIEASGVGTLPLVNLGVDAKGQFSGEFKAPKNGMYVLTYGGASTMLYLKRGQTLELSGKAMMFPSEMTITGEAKANNDFLKEAQKTFEAYASKIDMKQLLSKDESSFLKEFEKIQKDIEKALGETAKKLKADREVLDYKVEETNARLMGLLDAYKEQHGVMTGKNNFTVSKDFVAFQKKMEKNDDKWIRNFPMYRDYKLGKLQSDFQKYASSLPQNPKEQPLMAEVFADFLKTRKDLSQTAKDYFYAYVLAQSDLNFMNTKHYDKLSKLIDETISNAGVKADLKELQKVLMGFKAGTKPELKLTDAKGNARGLSDFHGKPTVVVFYASWNPNIALTTIPSLRDATNLYRGKADFVYVNLDDTKAQFEKTSAALLKGFPGVHYWVEGGIDSNAAKSFGLYGFKLPSYVVLDKEGNLYGRPFFNLNDPEFGETMAKLTGVRAPSAKLELPGYLGGEPLEGGKVEPAPKTE